MEIIVNDRECEACGKIMKFREVFNKWAEDVSYFYICENIDCTEYDINVNATVYIENNTKTVE